MRQMASVRKVHAEDGIAGFQDRQIHGHIRLAARMRLNIDVFGAKECFGALDCKVLDDVDEFASAVVPAARVSLGVLIGEYGTGRFEYGAIGEIFRRDQLQSFGLALFFVFDRGMDLGIKFLERGMNAVHTDLTFILL